MFKTFELFWKVISRPGDAFDYIKDKKPFYPTFAYLVIFGIVSYLSFYVSIGYFLSPEAAQLSPLIGEIQKSLPANLSNYIYSPLTAVLIMIYPPFITFFTAGMFSLLGEFVFKRTDGRALFIGFVFASVPSFISRIINTFLLSLFGFELPFYFTLIFLVWGVVLYVVAIEKIFRVSRRASSAIFFLPIIVIMLLILIFLSYFANVMSPILQSLSGA